MKERALAYLVCPHCHGDLALAATSHSGHDVMEGTLTFYEYHDRTCTAKVLSKGQGYVDSGHGHIARNESAAPARDVSVILAPVGQPFRGELSAPGPNCRKCPVTVE